MFPAEIGSSGYFGTALSPGQIAILSSSAVLH